MSVSRRASALGARGLIAGACVAVSLLAGCSADDVQGPPNLPGGDVGLEALVVPTGGLVGEWRLDNNVEDGSSNNFDATLFGSPPYIDAKIGKGLDLTGNGTSGQGGKYAEMPLNATLNNLSEGAGYSISAWFNPASEPSGTNPSTFWMVVGKTEAPAVGILYNMNGRFAARHLLNGEVLKVVIAGTASAINQWHHVVAVVTKGSSTVPGSLKLYVNGQLSNSTTWTGGTAAHDFGTTAKWRIGKSDDDWSAHGRVDQIRFYNVALDQGGVTELFNETPSTPTPTFRFYVGMSMESVGDMAIGGTSTGGPIPDGRFQRVNGDIAAILRNAHSQGRRVILKVTGDNPRFSTNGRFDFGKWKADFDLAGGTYSATAQDTIRKYTKNGTLLAHYALDEAIQDFTNLHPAYLDSVCWYQKEVKGWDFLPCLVREKNTKLDSISQANNYQFTSLDGGWGQVANNHLPYARQMTYEQIRQYYVDNLEAGRRLGLAFLYGFNLLDGGATVAGCDTTSSGQCAMTPDQLGMVANAIASIEQDQTLPLKGCGVNGWMVEQDNPHMDRSYFLRSDVQAALQDLWNKTAGAGMKPGPCSLRNLPAP